MAVGMEIRQRRTPPDGLGSMLRAARERAGLGLRHAARRADLSGGYMAHLEEGSRCPSRTVAARLADVLELDDDERAQLYAAAVTDAGADHPARTAA
ncbi:helix-turn-helix transcriptional regulator [Streptomyces sp. KN37]|uniref:helix-turn-helix domain-containing protein n=1 Tax=Streptomyces sp. KN37 TaxID=3090667 RepID=UPI002A749D1B|nr:helix-turn-helix transcriptional regulator [Streptomyces sp. KN37]WPO69927.1 helix-turn-helix transcriptional regulator [Streptomyces sp. KN37]